ncbi:hypothetical protein ONZ45_g11757 [Pleurotus djamor]|nr:hypothetical protein ONZ45_g11757 [Pleurotus djamor]
MEAASDMARRRSHSSGSDKEKVDDKVGVHSVNASLADEALRIVGFLVWEFPTVYIAQKLRLAKYLGANTVLWGMILMLHSVGTSFGAFFALRFLLGMLESCVAPLLILIISMFYKKNEQATRISWFYVMNSLTQVFGGFVSYGISFYDGHVLAPYQIMYLLMGGLAIIVGVCTLIWLPDSPVHATMLSQEEKIAALERIRDDQGGTENKRIKKDQVYEALLDIRTWLVVLSVMMTSIPNGGISNFSAIIIKSFGYTSRQALILGIPGGVVHGCMVLFCGWYSDKKNERTMPIVFALVPAILGSALLIAFNGTGQKGVLLFGIYIATTFGSALSTIYAYNASNTSGHTKKSTINALTMITFALGNVIGAEIFPPQDAPDYIPGKIAIMVLIVVQLGLTFLIRWVNLHLNQKKLMKIEDLKELHGWTDADVEKERQRHAFMDLTDKQNPFFVSKQSNLFVVFSKRTATIIVSPCLFATLDKSHHLATYLRDQRTNQKYYAAEGQAVISNWDANSTLKKSCDATLKKINSHSSPEVEAVGFGTPFLIPRKIRRPDIATKANESDAIPQDHAVSPIKKVKTTSRPLKSNPPKRKKDARSSSDLDEEHAARLLERKERKRVKRAIMQPDSIPVEDSRGDKSNKKPAKKAGKKEKKSQKEKLPPGFSLMYGLNAANIGANRITVKPPVSIGVFNKGKASLPAQPKTKPPKVKSKSQFSEGTFLKRLVNPAAESVQSEEERNEPESGSDTLSEASSSPSTPRSRKRSRARKAAAPATKKKSVPKPRPNPSIHPSESSESEATPTRKRDESVIWDIEQDDKLSLPSALSECKHLSPPTPLREGTVILNAQCLRPSQLVPSRSIVHSALEVDMDVSQLSLQPSDSASQVKACPPQIATISRFFESKLAPSVPAVCADSPPRLVSQRRKPDSGPPIYLDTKPSAPLTQVEPCDLPVSLDLDYSVPAPPSSLGSPERLPYPLLASSLHASLHLDFHRHVDNDSLLCGEPTQSSAHLELEDQSFPSRPVSPCDTLLLVDNMEASRLDAAFSNGQIAFQGQDIEAEEVSPLIRAYGFSSSYLPTDLFLERECLTVRPPSSYLTDDDFLSTHLIDNDDHFIEFPPSVMDNITHFNDSDPQDAFSEPYDTGSLLGQDDESISEVFSDQLPDRFYQGRALLLGMAQPGLPVIMSRELDDAQPLSQAEEDVVKLLRGHWHPQRF